VLGRFLAVRDAQTPRRIVRIRAYLPLIVSDREPFDGNDFTIVQRHLKGAGIYTFAEFTGREDFDYIFAEISQHREIDGAICKAQDVYRISNPHFPFKVTGLVGSTHDSHRCWIDPEDSRLSGDLQLGPTFGCVRTFGVLNVPIKVQSSEPQISISQEALVKLRLIPGSEQCRR